ncbi:unnamed protein product, partial [marine sediment metagenome]
MDLLHPNLQWLLTEMLPDGPLSILTNESNTFNRIVYFDQPSLKRIQELLNKKDIFFISDYKKLILLDGPQFLQELWLEGNQLTTLEGLGQLPSSLKILDISRNQLTTLEGLGP